MRVSRPRLILRSVVSTALIVLVALGSSCSSHPSAARGVNATTPSTMPSTGPSTGPSTMTLAKSPAPGREPVERTFAPFSAAGAPSVPISARADGSCWTSSIAVPKRGVYRCLSGDLIADPCFVPPIATAPPTVLCVAAPWSSATVLTLTSALPPASPVALTSNNPWALELANGKRCIISTGTVPTVAGIALNYVCGQGMSAGLVAATPAEVRYGVASGTSLATVMITEIWRG
jgi:hypothetical protein